MMRFDIETMDVVKVRVEVDSDHSIALTLIDQQAQMILSTYFHDAREIDQLIDTLRQARQLIWPLKRELRLV